LRSRYNQIGKERERKKMSLLFHLVLIVLICFGGACTSFKSCTECIQNYHYTGKACVWNNFDNNPSCASTCQASSAESAKTHCIDKSQGNGVCPRATGGGNSGDSNGSGGGFQFGSGGSSIYIPDLLKPCYQQSTCQNSYYVCMNDYDCVDLMRNFTRDYTDGYTPVRSSTNARYQDFYDCMDRECKISEQGISLAVYESCVNFDDCSASCSFQVDVDRKEHTWSSLSNCNTANAKIYDGILFPRLPNMCSYLANSDPYSAPTMRPTRSPTRYYDANPPTARPNYDKCIAFKVEGGVSSGGGYGFCTYWEQDKQDSNKFIVSQFQTYNTNVCPNDAVQAGFSSNGYNSPLQLVFAGRVFMKMPSIANIRITSKSNYYGRRLLQVDHSTHDHVFLDEGDDLMIIVELDFPAHRDVNFEFDLGGEVDNSVKYHEGHRHLTVKKGDKFGVLEVQTSDLREEMGDLDKYIFSIAGADGIKMDNDIALSFSQRKSHYDTDDNLYMAYAPEMVTSKRQDVHSHQMDKPEYAVSRSNKRMELGGCKDSLRGTPCNPVSFHRRRLLFGGVASECNCN